jgi:hypothetical protein
MIPVRRLTSSLLSVNAGVWHHLVSRGLLFSSKKGVSRDTLAWLQQPLDFSLAGMLRWWQTLLWNALVKDHSFSQERHRALGPDLATAHFVVARDGAVKFEGFSRWIKKNPVDGKYSLPSSASVGLKLEAIDVSDTNMMYVSFDSFVDLRHLKYLNVAGCAYIDDWCLDRFVQFRDSLLVLDVSRCPQVTERGLATLHKLHRLRRLRVYDMPAVQHKQLTAILLEEVLPPGCVVEGIDFNKQPEQDSSNVHQLPAFLKHYEDTVLEAERQKLLILHQAKQSSEQS